MNNSHTNSSLIAADDNSLSTNDNADDNKCRLFVGDLSSTCNEKDLLQLFEKYGEIEYIRVMRARRKTIASLGYCFIAFGNPTSALNAMTELDGVLLCGRKLRIRYAEHGISGQHHGSHSILSLHVRFETLNPKLEIYDKESADSRAINVNVTDEDKLRALFDCYGVIVDVAIKKSFFDKVTGLHKGYGFIHYSSFYDGLGLISKLLTESPCFVKNNVQFAVSASKNMKNELELLKSRNMIKVGPTEDSNTLNDVNILDSIGKDLIGIVSKKHTRISDVPTIHSDGILIRPSSSSECMNMCGVHHMDSRHEESKTRDTSSIGSSPGTPPSSYIFGNWGVDLLSNIVGLAGMDVEPVSNIVDNKMEGDAANKHMAAEGTTDCTGESMSSPWTKMRNSNSLLTLFDESTSVVTDMCSASDINNVYMSACGVVKTSSHKECIDMVDSVPKCFNVIPVVKPSTNNQKDMSEAKRSFSNETLNFKSFECIDWLKRQHLQDILPKRDAVTATSIDQLSSVAAHTKVNGTVDSNMNTMSNNTNTLAMQSAQQTNKLQSSDHSSGKESDDLDTMAQYHQRYHQYYKYIVNNFNR